MLTRKQFGSLLGGAAIAGLLPSEALAFTHLRALFSIARSKNKNVVRYVARCQDQRLDTTQPIAAHWLMLAEDGRREELTWTERQLAYGFSASRISCDGCQLQLVAFKARTIAVERHGQGFRALLTIAGRRAELERIFVQTSEGALLPSVVHVDLYGKSLEGAPLSERIAAR
jgi:hypothetical protein